MASVAPHVQDIDEALQLNIYVGECQRVLTGDVSKKKLDAEKELTELLKVRKGGEKGTSKIINNVEFTVADRKATREKCLNGKKVKKNRKWLQNILLAESSSEDEANPKIDDMIRLHKIRLRCLERFYQRPKLRRFKYYGAGLLVNNNEISELRNNVSFPIPKGFKNGPTLNGGKRSGAGFTCNFGGPNFNSTPAPKTSPRKPKKKKQPPLPLPVSQIIAPTISNVNGDDSCRRDSEDIQQEPVQPAIATPVSEIPSRPILELSLSTDIDPPNLVSSSLSASGSGSVGGANL